MTIGSMFIATVVGSGIFCSLGVAMDCRERLPKPCDIANGAAAGFFRPAVAGGHVVFDAIDRVEESKPCLLERLSDIQARASCGPGCGPI